MLNTTQVNEAKKIISNESRELPMAFSALSDPGRFRIFKLLLQKNDLCVTDIANVLGISVPAASQQLKIIELSGLVRKCRNGQKICYSVKRENPIVRSLVRVVNNFA